MSWQSELFKKNEFRPGSLNYDIIDRKVAEMEQQHRLLIREDVQRERTLRKLEEEAGQRRAADLLHKLVEAQAKLDTLRSSQQPPQINIASQTSRQEAAVATLTMRNQESEAVHPREYENEAGILKPSTIKPLQLALLQDFERRIVQREDCIHKITEAFSIIGKLYRREEDQLISEQDELNNLQRELNSETEKLSAILVEMEENLKLRSTFKDGDEKDSVKSWRIKRLHQQHLRLEEEEHAQQGLCTEMRAKFEQTEKLVKKCEDVVQDSREKMKGIIDDLLSEFGNMVQAKDDNLENVDVKAHQLALWSMALKG